MPLSHPKRPSARRSFIISPYSPDRDGKLIAALPTRCPKGVEADTPCAIKAKGWRKRKTGPGFPLRVLWCKSHNEHFTLYPPGYAPYQRAPVLRLAPDGARVLDEEGKALAGAKSFEGTLFEAVIEARQKRPWARNSNKGVPDRWWSTQGRHLALALRLTGVSESTDERLQETLAMVLGVRQLVIHEVAQRPKRGYEERGKAAWSVLRLVPRGRIRALRLLLCGYLIGKWGEPWSWDPRRGALERLPFRFAGTAAPT